MRTPFAIVGVVSFVLSACGGSFPQPTDRLASAEAAARSARELGAEREPKAQLHLKVALEQIDKAKQLIADGDNKGADLTLQCANADAELAVMLAKENAARTEADRAQEKVQNLKAGK